MWLRTLFNKKPIKAELPNASELVEGRLETHSLTWLFITKWAVGEINKLRIKNDTTTKTEVQTAVIRGQILALKSLLDLPEDPAKFKLVPDDANVDLDAGY